MKYTLPAIANTITKEGMTHFVVIFKITDKYVVVGEPAKDLVRMKIDDFYKDFTGVMLILKPNEEFTQGKNKGKKIFDREAGDGLSGGEKQRIALSRAFLKKNEFYILDESTSNLDFGTENIIFDMIYNKYRDKTMLIIAHRLATIKDCDIIIVLDEGEIIEQGTHEKLIEQQGEYYDLWQMQQGNFNR